MDNLSNEARVTTRGGAPHFAPSEHITPQPHVSACVLSTCNAPDVLHPIKNSALQPLTVAGLTTTCDETISKVDKLMRETKTKTKIAKAMGFESVPNAKDQLTEGLIQQEQELKDRIGNIDTKNTPSTTSKFHELKHLLHRVKQAQTNLSSPPQTSPAKRASCLKRFLNFIQCKKSMTPPKFCFYGAPFSIDVSAIRRSHPSEKLNIEFNKEITKLHDRTLVIEKYCQAKLEATAEENERVIVVQGLKKTLDQFKKTEAELERLKTAFGKHHFKLSELINTCTSVRKKLDRELTAYIDKQRTVSIEKIKQICSESVSLVKRTEELLKTTKHKFLKEADYEIQKKVLIEDIDRCRTAIIKACSAIRSKGTWYEIQEFTKLNDALKKIDNSARELNFKERNKNLTDVGTFTIPRAKLKSPNNPTQSTC